MKKKILANGSIQPSVSNRPTEKTIDDDDRAMSDVDKAHNDEKPQIMGQSRQLTKGAKKQEVRGSMIEKIKAQTKASTTRPVKEKPAPIALSQTRTRRTAAVEANKKIQSLDEFNDIVDDEEVVLLPKATKQNSASRAPKASTSQVIRGSNDGRPTSGKKLLIQKPSTKNSILDNLNSSSLEEQPKKTKKPESVLESIANSNSENVDLVRDAPAQTLLRDLNDTGDNLPKANPTSAPEQSVVPLHLDHDKHFSQPKTNLLEKGDEVNRAKLDMAPKRVPKLQENIDDTEPTRARSRQDHKVGDHDAVDLAGLGDEDHVEDVLPHQSKTQVDGVESEVTAPQARMVVELRQTRTSPSSAKAPQKASPEFTPERVKPFGAKLNALMPKSRDITAKIKTADVLGHVHVESKGPNTPKPAEEARPSREPKARAVDKLASTSNKEATQVKNPQRHLKSAMQIGGEGEQSLIQMLKPAGESTPTFGIESKGKIEKLGDTSHKRVKLAPQEQSKGVSTRRKPAGDDEKTPPPVVSNRPIVIGFSAIGPRNQGTISTKKPKPPKNGEDRAPRAEKLRKHDTSTINQVEAGFENASGAHMKPGDSSEQIQSERLTTVDAFATREITTQKHPAQKRKLAPFVDDPAPWEHEQLSKRQKRSIKTPPTVHKHHPKMLPDPSPAMIHDRSQFLSSQNTRVNENGSPMPSRITRNASIATGEQYLDEDDGKDALAEAQLEEQFVLQDDDLTLPEPMLPHRLLPPAISTSQRKTTAHKGLSNNSKQVPSSPHAPSIFGTMPPHHIYHDGEIVNTETKESIIPVKPQNPFLSASQNPQNPFVSVLRKTTKVEDRRLDSGINNKRGSGGVVTRPSLNAGEDPDKTLVEPNLRKKYKQVPVSYSSSSSQSGPSTETSQSDESSEEESDAEIEAIWRKQLEPHQENMLDCLQTISHVSNNNWHYFLPGTDHVFSVWFDI